MRATSCVKPSGIIIIIIKSTLSATQHRQNIIERQLTLWGVGAWGAAGQN